jgi:hypothetical protein
MDQGRSAGVGNAAALTEQLRVAIARRAGLRPGTLDHRRASGEVRHLQERLVAEIGAGGPVVTTSAAPLGLPGGRPR